MGQRHSHRLQLRLLGPASWATEGRQGDLTGRFAPLAAYVAVTRTVARDTMARMLWGGGDLEKARASLRQHVRRLRKATDHPFVEQADSIQLASGVDCDVWEQPAEWLLPELISRGDFLAGFELPGHPSINFWIAQQRRHWYGLLCDTMVARAVELTSSSELAGALQYVCMVTDSNPGLESGWRARMWLHYLAGDRSAAIEAHHRLDERLAHLGVAPSAQTQALWDEVRLAAQSPVRRPEQQLGLTRPPRLIARTSEWAAMESAYSLGRSFLLRGEGGIGKTRLLGDFVHHRGRAVLVHARKGDQDSPYATLGAVLRAAMEAYRVELDPATLRAIGSVLRELNRQGGLGPADKLEIWSASERLLERAAREGLVTIAVDNFHHADAASIETFVRLASYTGARRPHFALAARGLGDDDRGQILNDWQAESLPLQVIDLPPLSQAEVADLLASLDLVGPPARVTAAELFGHVGGNPLLLLETLREVLHGGIQSAPGTLPRPTVVLSVLARRLHSVRAATLPLLQLCSVLDADIGQAAAALGHTEDELAFMQQELREQGIVRDGGVVHDLMREVVLAGLGPDERRHWCGKAAELLTSDRRVPRSRVGALWEAGERWSEAGTAFLAAGTNARDAGRLAESRILFNRSAECCRRGGEATGRFEALFESFDAELDLYGADSAQNLAGRLRDLAVTPEQCARVSIAFAKVAVVRYDMSGKALLLSGQALQLCAEFQHLRPHALSVHALGLAQSLRFDEAIEAGREAMNLELAVGATPLSREIASNLVYAYFAANRVGDAIMLARPLLEDFKARGDRASIASMEGNLATLLLLAGDPVASIGLSTDALQRHRELDPTASSPLAVDTRTTLGAALAHIGRFREALAVMTEHGPELVARSAVLQQARLKLTLVHVWLLLGQDGKAVEALGPHEDSWPAPAQVRRDAALAAAASMGGYDNEAPRRRVRESQLAMQEVSLMNMPWIEWSREGDPVTVADQMREIHCRLIRDGRPGAARTAQLRLIHCLCAITSPEATREALDLAADLRVSLQEGLMAQIYLPEAWCILADAFEKAGQAPAASACLRAGWEWVELKALPNVPDEWKESFMKRNPVNRRLYASVFPAGSADPDAK